MELPHDWELVLTAPAGRSLPTGSSRRTLECFVGLINEAGRQIRLAAPFVDRVAMEYLSPAIAAALSRGAGLDVLLARGAQDDSLAKILLRNVPHALHHRVATHLVEKDGPWPHLKVLTVDGAAAYVGSANLTRRGLSDGNLELGVLLRGNRVALVDAVLDTLFAMQQSIRPK